MTVANTETLNFSTPAIYEIAVAGNMDLSMSARLADMQISVEEKLANKNKYLLVGKLKDQAELIGILNTLYELHLILLSVKIP